MRRRTVLAAIGVAAVGSLAGCSSGCSPTSTDESADDAETGWHQVGGDPAKTGRVGTDAGPPAADGNSADPTFAHWNLWEYADSEDERRSYATAPVVADGRAFAATGVDNNRVEDPTGRLYALEPGTEPPVWSASLPDGASGAPAVVDGAVVVPTRAESLVAVDVESGDERWSVALGATPGTPTVAGGHLYVGDDAGHLNVVDPAEPGRCGRHSLVPTGARLLNPPRPALAAPAVADGTAYAVLDTETDTGGDREQTLVALDIGGGSVAWRYEVTARSDPRAPAVNAESGTVYLPLDGALHAVDAADGTRQWRFATGYDRPSRPAVGDGTVYFSAKNVYALDAASGEEGWRLVNRATRSMSSDALPRQDAPAVGPDGVYVGLGALDAATGDPLWGEFGDSGLSEYFGGRWYEGNVVPAGPAVADGVFAATLRFGRVVMAR